MGIFEGVAANKTQPVSTGYSQAAQLINLGCGPGYVNQTVAKTTSAGSALLHETSPLLMTISVAVLAATASVVQLL